MNQLVKRNLNEFLIVDLSDIDLLLPVLVVTDYYCSDVIGNCLTDYVSACLVEIVVYFVISL